MADPPAQPGSAIDPDQPPTRGMPRWVKVSLIVVVGLVLVFVVLQLLGVGGRHGPMRHGRGGASRIAEDAVTIHGPPSGVGHGRP
jgi:hypothetical protein